ncbi:MAG: hypothetical protein OWT28_12590 [Firmicutes bacterium]|nr:hypothetical protein [Bacillota bacterium]
MLRFGLLTDQSRKSKAARLLYEHVRTKGKATPTTATQVGPWPVQAGYDLATTDRARVVDLRLHEEHMSPYFKTDMNLFHLLMLDDKIEMAIYKTSEGILLAFEGLPENPEPFGAHGHDMR